MTVGDESIDPPGNCALCGAEITRETEPAGVIYSRIQIDGRWISAAICTADYMRDKPNFTRPTRIIWEAFE